MNRESDRRKHSWDCKYCAYGDLFVNEPFIKLYVSKVRKCDRDKNPTLQMVSSTSESSNCSLLQVFSFITGQQEVDYFSRNFNTKPLCPVVICGCISKSAFKLRTEHELLCYSGINIVKSGMALRREFEREYCVWKWVLSVPLGLYTL